MIGSASGTLVPTISVVRETSKYCRVVQEGLLLTLFNSIVINVLSMQSVIFRSPITAGSRRTVSPPQVIEVAKLRL